MERACETVLTGDVHLVATDVSGARSPTLEERRSRMGFVSVGSPRKQGEAPRKRVDRAGLHGWSGAQKSLEPFVILACDFVMKLPMQIPAVAFAEHIFECTRGRA